MDLGIMIPLIGACILNVVTIYLSKKTFGKCLPLTMLLATFIVYFSQMILQTFMVGFAVLTVWAISGIVLLVWKSGEKTFRNNLLSYGLFAFIVIYLVFLVVDFRRSYSTWDELSHWGVMVKEMLRLDCFYAEPASNLLVHKEYPPFVSVYEMLWCKISGGYSEAGTTLSLHVFTLVLLNSQLAENDRKEVSHKVPEQFVKAFFSTMLFVMIILAFDTFQIFNTIYTDYFMPVLYVYIVMLIASRSAVRDRFGYLCFCVSLPALILSKQMSIAFVLLAYAFFLFGFFSYQSENAMVNGQENKNVRQMVKKFGIILLPLILVFVNYSIWKNYTNSLQIQGQFELGQIQIRSILEIMMGGGTETQHETYRRFLIALCSTPLFEGIFKMTYVSSLFIALLLVMMIYHFYKSVCMKRDAAAVGILFIVGSAGYAFTMFVLYMFCYSSEEMKQLASFNRYMDSYIVSEFLILFSWWMLLIKKTKPSCMNGKMLMIVWMFSLILLNPERLTNLLPQVIYGEPFYDYRQQAAALQNKTGDDTEIFVISNNNTQNIYYLNYYLNDRRMNVQYLYKDISSVEPTDEGTWNAIIQSLQQSDFVYIMDAGEGADVWLSPYAEDGYVHEYTVYQVVKSDMGFRLIEQM